MRFRILTFLFMFAALCQMHGQVPTGFIQVSQNRLLDSTGTNVSSATVCAQPLTTLGIAASIRVGGGGTVISSPVCVQATNGSWTMNLPDTSLSQPANACFTLTATDNLSGNSLIGPGYTCVQPTSQASPNGWCTSGVCNVDSLPPMVKPIVSQVYTGQQGATGAKGDPGCPVGQTGCVGVLLTQPGVDQSINQTAGSSFTPNKQNGQVYNVRAWCSTPGVLDDTCFRNAINDAAAHGFLGYANHRYAELVVSPEIYHFATSVTVPALLNIGIHGTMESGIYGSTIDTAISDGLVVLSDNVDIKHISFFQNSGTKHNGVTFGNASTPVYDSHINWCWFIGENAAIHAVNASGLDLSHNTFDSGTKYGILSDVSLGDKQLIDVIAIGLRGFNELSAIYINGDGTDAFSDIQLGGIFDNTQAGGTAVSISNARAISIQGDFNKNPYDLKLYGINGAVVGPFTVHNSYTQPITIAASQNVNIHNGTMVNLGLSELGTGSAISVTGSFGTIVHDIETISANGVPTANILNGLSIDSTSGNSSVYANRFLAQQGAAYNLQDASDYLLAQSLRVDGSLVSGTGFQHGRQAGCTTAATATSACSATFTWTVPFSNTAYTPMCTLESVSGAPVLSGITAKSATAITVQIVAQTNAPASGLLDCMAAHD